MAASNQKDHLKAPLDDYMAQYPKVKIVRLAKREGLIRARLLGLEHATAPVVTYLDSHCECTEGQYEASLSPAQGFIGLFNQDYKSLLRAGNRVSLQAGPMRTYRLARNNRKLMLNWYLKVGWSLFSIE